MSSNILKGRGTFQPLTGDTTAVMAPCSHGKPRVFGA